MFDIIIIIKVLSISPSSNITCNHFLILQLFTQAFESHTLFHSLAALCGTVYKALYDAIHSEIL